MIADNAKTIAVCQRVAGSQDFIFYFQPVGRSRVEAGVGDKYIVTEWIGQAHRRIRAIDLIGHRAAVTAAERIAPGDDLSIGTQILILLTLMISSKGIAAVPRASLVVITGTLAMFGLPVEGVALIFAIDQFLDMGRTATNVVGNAVATSVITKWEGMLEAEEPADMEHPHAPSHTVADGKAGLDLAGDMVEDARTKPV